MRKRKGFSLLAVLILGIVSMTIVGVIFRGVVDSSGAGRAAARSGVSYNFLQSEIEKARAALKSEMFSRTDAIRCGLSESDTIYSLDDIEVWKDGAPFWRVDGIERVGGRAGDVSVRIYDMGYSPASVASAAVGETLPPSVSLNTTVSGVDEAADPGTPVSGGTPDAGIYLIRAAIVFDDNVANKIDLAVIQNSNPDA